MIWPSINFNPTGGECELLNECLNTLRFKDRAWKFKKKVYELFMLEDARSINDDHAFHGVPKDWAWKFKEKVICSSSVF